MADKFIEIWDIDVTQLRQLIEELGQSDLVVDRDFTFRFQPAWLNYRDGEGEHRRSVRFWFTNDRLNTWFQLKYSNYGTS